MGQTSVPIVCPRLSNMQNGVGKLYNMTITIKSFMLENTRGNGVMKFSLNNGLRKKKEQRKKKREVRIRFGSKLKNMQAEKRTSNHEKNSLPICHRLAIAQR